jgi:hypothetical protein
MIEDVPLQAVILPAIPIALSLSLSLSLSLTSFCHSVPSHIPGHDVLPYLTPWTKTSEKMSQNKPFLPQVVFLMYLVIAVKG